MNGGKGVKKKKIISIPNTRVRGRNAKLRDKTVTKLIYLNFLFGCMYVCTHALVCMCVYIYMYTYS